MAMTVKNFDVAAINDLRQQTLDNLERLRSRQYQYLSRSSTTILGTISSLCDFPASHSGVLDSPGRTSPTTVKTAGSSVSVDDDKWNTVSSANNRLRSEFWKHDNYTGTDKFDISKQVADRSFIPREGNGIGYDSGSERTLYRREFDVKDTNYPLITKERTDSYSVSGKNLIGNTRAAYVTAIGGNRSELSDGGNGGSAGSAAAVSKRWKDDAAWERCGDAEKSCHLYEPYSSSAIVPGFGSGLDYGQISSESRNVPGITDIKKYDGLSHDKGIDLYSTEISDRYCRRGFIDQCDNITADVGSYKSSSHRVEIPQPRKEIVVDNFDGGIEHPVVVNDEIATRLSVRDAVTSLATDVRVGSSEVTLRTTEEKSRSKEHNHRARKSSPGRKPLVQRNSSPPRRSSPVRVAVRKLSPTTSSRQGTPKSILRQRKIIDDNVHVESKFKHTPTKTGGRASRGTAGALNFSYSDADDTMLSQGSKTKSVNFSVSPDRCSAKQRSGVVVDGTARADYNSKGIKIDNVRNDEDRYGDALSDLLTRTNVSDVSQQSGVSYRSRAWDTEGSEVWDVERSLRKNQGRDGGSDSGQPADNHESRSSQKVSCEIRSRSSPPESLKLSHKSRSREGAGSNQEKAGSGRDVVGSKRDSRRLSGDGGPHYLGPTDGSYTEESNLDTNSSLKDFGTRGGRVARPGGLGGVSGSEECRVDGATKQAHLLTQTGNDRKHLKIVRELESRPKSDLFTTPTDNFESRGGASSKSRPLADGQTEEYAKLLESRQGPPLLGYDWIAGVLDNDQSAGPVESDAVIDGLREFRRQNRDECIGSVAAIHNDELSRTNQPEVRNPEHTCIHGYTVNDRLFTQPVTVDSNGISVCPVCMIPRKEPSKDAPGFVRVSIPKSRLEEPYKIKPHRRRSFDPIDSCALSQHCMAGYDCARPSMIPTASNVDLKAAVNGVKAQMITTEEEAHRIADFASRSAQLYRTAPPLLPYPSLAGSSSLLNTRADTRVERRSQDTKTDILAQDTNTSAHDLRREKLRGDTDIRQAHTGSDKLVERQRDRRTDKYADRQTDRQADKHTDKQTERLTDRQTDRLRDSSRTSTSRSHRTSKTRLKS